MKISRTHLFASLLLVPCVLMLATPFASAPKAKGQSASKLKEQCAQELGEQLKRFGRIMQQMGAVQDQVLEHTYAVLENDKDHALYQKNAAELQVCCATMREFNESLQKIEEQLRAYNLFLERL